MPYFFGGTYKKDPNLENYPNGRNLIKKAWEFVHVPFHEASYFGVAGPESLNQLPAFVISQAI